MISHESPPKRIKEINPIRLGILDALSLAYAVRHSDASAIARNDSYVWSILKRRASILAPPLLTLMGMQVASGQIVRWLPRNLNPHNWYDGLIGRELVKGPEMYIPYEGILPVTTWALRDVRDFAKQFTTHPAIIIGRLQHKKLIPYSLGREYFEQVIFE